MESRISSKYVEAYRTPVEHSILCLQNLYLFFCECYALVSPIFSPNEVSQNKKILACSVSAETLKLVLGCCVVLVLSQVAVRAAQLLCFVIPLPFRLTHVLGHPIFHSYPNTATQP